MEYVEMEQDEMEHEYEYNKMTKEEIMKRKIYLFL